MNQSLRTLIIPCAGRSSRYPNMRPKWLLTHPDGQIMIEKVLNGLDTSFYSRIIITIVREHDQKFEASTILAQVLKNFKNLEIFIIDEFTSSPAETVFLTVKEKNVQGPFVIKDSDNFVAFNDPGFDSFIAGLNLNRGIEVPNIPNKGFLVVNDQELIVDVVEKKICSDRICLGIYGFDSADSFYTAYNVLSGIFKQQGRELYLSHVISYLIKELKQVYQYVEADNYEDWGTVSEWRNLQKKQVTIFCDVDGVLLENTGKYGQKNWDNTLIPLPANIQTLKILSDRGAQLILTTSRPENYRETLEGLLKQNGIRVHSIVFGCNHSARIIVNDFAPSNPYPSCLAISMPRNGNLSDYFKDYL